MDDDIDEIMGREDLDLDNTEEANANAEHTTDGTEEETTEKQGGEDTQREEETEVSNDSGGEEKAEEKETQQTEGEQEEKQETPKPLTVDDIRTAISDMRNDERASAKELDALTDEVLKQYYPDGLSNVLVDSATGKELRSPQDVVDAAGGTMSIEEAQQWLLNEQYKLDTNIAKIKDDARNLAETNANFSKGIERVINKYKDVFAKFPEQQQKIYKQYMKQVQIDDQKNLVLSAPDVEDFYDFVMEPYVLAYGNIQAQQSVTPPAEDKPKIPESKPSIKDRLDESGDGGSTGREADPNNADESLKELFGE